MVNCDRLNLLAKRVNENPLTSIRLSGWMKVIKWEVEEEEYYWSTNGKVITQVNPLRPDVTLKCSSRTLERLVHGDLSFFIGIWGSGEIAFEGTFADAYRLGYLFLSDKRQRRVVFVSHCWLNINTRFPEGCTFAGADTPIIQALLDEGLGLIQMPCPEYECLGLEKGSYGKIVGDELRECFRTTAQSVVKQIKDYLALGFDIEGVIGMDPSPSCGVGIAKGKGTMLGIDRDTSEKNESGVFIEELEKLLCENGIEGINVFGIRRHSLGENADGQRIKLLKAKLKRNFKDPIDGCGT